MNQTFINELQQRFNKELHGSEEPDSLVFDMNYHLENGDLLLTQVEYSKWRCRARVNFYRMDTNFIAHLVFTSLWTRDSDYLYQLDNSDPRKTLEQLYHISQNVETTERAELLEALTFINFPEWV